MIYRDASIGNAINVAVVRIHVLSEGEVNELADAQINKSFANWTFVVSARPGKSFIALSHALCGTFAAGSTNRQLV